MVCFCEGTLRYLVSFYIKNASKVDWAQCQCNDDVMTWKCVPRYLPFVKGIHGLGDLTMPHYCIALLFSLLLLYSISVWTNSPIVGYLISLQNFAVAHIHIQNRCHIYIKFLDRFWHHSNDNVQADGLADRQIEINTIVAAILCCHYRQTSNISITLVGNKIVDHSDVVRAAPTGDAPTTSSFST